jgi:CDP-glycerol glycerophosphotransferase (TagB/SpsB family)
VIDGVTGLYEAFNEADLLVSDVSSVVTDFLWSRKPYVMTNPAGLPEDEYRREFPSSGGAAIWGKDLATMDADIRDARTTDVRRAVRETVAQYLLGAHQNDATAGFAAAVYDALDAGAAQTISDGQSGGSQGVAAVTSETRGSALLESNT